LSERFRALGLLVRSVGGFLRLFGMVVCYLRVLARFVGIAFFMRGSGVSMRFGGFVVMSGCFVVIVF
jgi:hypothetical protein